MFPIFRHAVDRRANHPFTVGSVCTLYSKATSFLVEEVFVSGVESTKIDRL